MDEKNNAPGGEGREQGFRTILEAHCAEAGDTAADRIKVYEKYDGAYAAELKRRAGIASATSE